MDSSVLKYLDVFYLVAAAQGLCFAVKQLRLTGQRKLPRRLLLLLLLLFILVLAEAVLRCSARKPAYVGFMTLGEPLAFLFGPLLYFYFKSSLAGSALRRADLLHGLPFLLWFLYSSQLCAGFFRVHIDLLYHMALITLSHVIYSLLIWKKFRRRSVLFHFIAFHVLGYTRLVDGCANYSMTAAISMFIYLFAWFGTVRPRIFEKEERG